MDFDSCCSDCCKGCSQTSQNYKPQISGQGDWKFKNEIQTDYSSNADKGKKFGSSAKGKTAREADKPSLKAEKPKRFLDVYCNCSAKIDKKHECKLKQEARQDKNDADMYDKHNNSWCEWKSKMEKFHGCEVCKHNDYFSSNKLAESILELEEKVNYLLQIARDENKMPEDCIKENTQTKTAEPLMEDTWQLINFNKRLCAAEEGIEKLALVLEEVLKGYGKKRGCSSPEDNMSISDSLDFNEIIMEQRINFLKNRNDMLMNFLKVFLKSNSIEELSSRLPLILSGCESKPSLSNFKMKGKAQSKDLNLEELMESLIRLRSQQMVENQQEQVKNYTEEQSNKVTKKEFGLKYLNKLEAIPEQAELAFNQNEGSKNPTEELLKKNDFQNLKEKLSQISNDMETKDYGEAVQKPSFEKMRAELVKKNYFESNLNQICNSQESFEEDNDICDIETRYDSSSENDCTFCEKETTENSTYNDISSIINKYLNEDEFKEPTKQEKCLRMNPNNQPKDNRKVEEHPRPSRKSSHKTEFSIVLPPQKPGRNPCCRELGSPTREESKDEIPRRPVTAPVSRNKPLPHPNFKLPVPEKVKKKNPGINPYVKNKNKILLNKKSFVQTS